MLKVYIVCENITINNIQKPMDWKNMPLEPPIFNDFRINDDSQISIKKPFDFHLPLQPRFEPIMPFKEPVIHDSKPNNIVCICKDMDTAKYYLSGFPNRYILGPFNIL